LNAEPSAFLYQRVFNGLDPLRRIGDFEGGGISLILGVDKIYFDQGHMQIDPFVGAVVVHPGDTAAGNLQFYFFPPAAVKQAVREQQEETRASARFTWFGGQAEKVDAEAYGPQVLAAEALVDPLAVPPADDGHVGQNAEKYQGNDNPLLVFDDIKHGQPSRFYLNPAK